MAKLRSSMASPNLYVSIQNRAYERNLQIFYEDLVARNSTFQEVKIGGNKATLTSCRATKIHTLYGKIIGQNCTSQTFLGGSGVDLTDCQGQIIQVEAGSAKVSNREPSKRVFPKDFVSIEAPVLISLENVSVQQANCTAGSIEARNSHVDVLKAQDTIRLVDSIATSILFSVLPGRIYDLHLEGTSRVIGPILLQKREEPMANQPMPPAFTNSLKYMGKEKIQDREDLENKNDLPKDLGFRFKQILPLPVAAQEEAVTLRIHGGSGQEQVLFVGCTGEINRFA